MHKVFTTTTTTTTNNNNYYYYPDLARELKKTTTTTMEHESDDDTNCNWYFWFSHQRIGTRTRGLGNKRTSWDLPNYIIIEIGQNIGKSSGDLRKLAVTQTPVENHRLTLVGKTWIIIIIRRILDTTGWSKWSTGSYARNLNLTIRTYSICTTQHLSWRMKHINSYGNLTYKRVT